MENFNFKEIAERCLAGELSGVFVNRQGDKFHSSKLSTNYEPEYPYQIEDAGVFTEYGHYYAPVYVIRDLIQMIAKEDIVDFIEDEDMKTEQKQITINVPEGKKAVQEIVDGEIHIKFVDNKLTYEDMQNLTEKEEKEIRKRQMQEDIERKD